MANTIPGFMRNSAPFWARGQDAFLVIAGSSPTRDTMVYGNGYAVFTFGESQRDLNTQHSDVMWM